MSDAALPAVTSRVARHPDAERSWYPYVRSILPVGDERDMRWADFGCGFGEFLESCSPYSDRAIGFDLDRRALTEARKSELVVLCGDLTRSVPLRSGVLGGATLIEVVEHLFDSKSVLEELARVIRPGGWLILTTPNVAHLTYRIRAVTGHSPKQEGYHVRFFNRDRLLELLESSGFRLEARASYGKQALLTKGVRIARRLGIGSPTGSAKVRYRVGARLEPLLAQRFVWRLRRK